MNNLQIQIGQIAGLFNETLKIGKFYDVSNHKIEIETPSGFKPVKNLVLKQLKTATVFFATGTITCAATHIFITPQGQVKAESLQVGDEVIHRDGVVNVESIIISDKDEIFYDLEIDSDEHVYFTADGVLHHNTGKTQTVEDTLEKLGLSDGSGYFKNTGTASPFGIYEMLYKNRNNIVLFDDSDGALADQDGRNLIKAATDTKKKRKLAWSKKNSKLYDPALGVPQIKKSGKNSPVNDDDEFGDVDIDDDMEDKADMIPSYFDFEGRIIFISNLPLNKLDPDGALRTRAFIISINPTKAELLERMEQIMDSIKLEAGHLTHEQRREVLEVIKGRSPKKEMSLRTLVRSLNLAASGVSNWRKLVELYG